MCVKKLQKVTKHMRGKYLVWKSTGCGSGFWILSPLFLIFFTSFILFTSVLFTGLNTYGTGYRTSIFFVPRNERGTGTEEIRRVSTLFSTPSFTASSGTFEQ